MLIQKLTDNFSSYSNLESQSSLVVKKSEVSLFPIYALNRLSINPTEVIKFTLAEKYRDLLNLIDNSNFKEFIILVMSQLCDSEYFDIDEVEAISEEIPSFLDSYLIDGNNEFGNNFNSPMFSLDQVSGLKTVKEYSTLINSNNKTINNSWLKADMRNNVFISNYYFLGDNISKKILWCLCVKSKYIEYYRLCCIMGEIPNPNIFVFLVDPVIENKGAEYKFLRQKYKSDIRSFIVDQGIEIVVDSNINENFFNKIEIPLEANTISKMKEWLKESSDDFHSFEKTRQNLEARNIDLQLA